MSELESIDMCRPGWHHELWLIDSHLLLIGPGLWTMSIVLSVKLIHLRNILSDEHYKFETVSYYPYKKDSKCLQKFSTLILPNPISPSSVFDPNPNFTLTQSICISYGRVSTLILLLPTWAFPHFTLILPLFHPNSECIQTRISPKLQFLIFFLRRPKTQYQLDQNLSYEFEQHCGSCDGPPDFGHSSRGIQEPPSPEAQNEWYLTSKTSSAFAWSRANCASHSQSARSHVFASSRHFSSPLF